MMITETYKGEGVGIRMRVEFQKIPCLIPMPGVRKVKKKRR